MFLENWKEYLLKNIFRLKKPEDFGYLYEEFISQDVAFRKAGGVYYTPQYIVDYIVENTLGIQIKGKNPSEIALIKIIDPSCGSGSFLLGAYQYLLNYHLEYYTKEKEKNGFSDALNANNTLKTAIKKQILVNNIFGIDIDTQAVEVSKLSLLIKCMEGETAATVLDTNLILKESVLPSLEENIFAGNSLIASDFYDGGLFPTAKEMRMINVFDWENGFSMILKNGGFDAIIGNPPYLSTKRGFAETPKINQYLKKNYTNAVGQFDAYMLFIEKASLLCKTNAYWGFIIPKPILTNQNMQIIRNNILENGTMTNIADFGMPFKDASVEAVAICQIKQKSDIKTAVDIFKFDKENEVHFLQSHTEIDSKYFYQTAFNSFVVNINANTEDILLKIEDNSTILKHLVKTFMRGVECGKKDVCIKTKNIRNQFKKLLRGEDVKRYNVDYQNFWIEIDKNDKAKFKDNLVYECGKKILIRRVGIDLQATIDTESYWNLNTIYNIHLKNDTYEYVLGIINSKLMQYWFRRKFVFEDKLFPYARVSQLEQLPIKILDLTEKNNLDKYNKMVELVSKMLDLNTKISKAKTPSDKQLYQRLIENIENQINELVFDLYALTSEEKEIILGE